MTEDEAAQTRAWVYGKDGTSEIVTQAERAKRIKGGDWADTPAAFPEAFAKKAAAAGSGEVDQLREELAHRTSQWEEARDRAEKWKAKADAQRERADAADAVLASFRDVDQVVGASKAKKSGA